MNDDFDNARDDAAMRDRHRRQEVRDFIGPVGPLPGRVAHEATYAPEEGGGYLVTCPEGCPLGTSAHQGDEDGAKGRIALHRLATAPLGPQGLVIP